MLETNNQQITDLLKEKRNLIFFGSYGSGNTYLAKTIARQMIFGNDKDKITEDEHNKFEEQCCFVQFHPSYDYTDFVEGLRPIQDDNGNVGFECKYGVFKMFCATAIHNPEKTYVFIINDINLGDISKIFGELFFSIDPSFRGKDGMVHTKYSYDQIFVPENVYIIGTMSVSNQEIERMDIAFRCRFTFVEAKQDGSYKLYDSIKLKKMPSIIDTTIMNNTTQDYLNKNNQLLQKAIEDGDYDSVVTKCRTIIEECYCYGIEKKGEKKSEDGELNSLRKQFGDLYGITRTNNPTEVEKNINDIYSGINKIADAIGRLRNKNSDAHGVGAARVPFKEFEARLLANSAKTICEYLLSIVSDETIK